MNEKNECKILIIDDDVNMMEIITVVLNKYGHKVCSFTEPVTAIEELKNNKYDILLINYLMTPVNGDKIIELVRAFDKQIYIILMSMHRDLAPSIETIQELDIQGYFEKSSNFDQLIMLIQSGIKYTKQLNEIKSMSIQLEQYIVDFAKILLNTIGAKDHYTEGHSIRVSNYLENFAKYINIPEKDIETLKTAAHFHDIGKIGIPDNILLKEGKLTDDEYETIKLHPVLGANILNVSEIFKDATPIIIAHHERIDGKGYPYNLKGDKIPYYAKMLAICDSFDAITARRSYKEEQEFEFALEEIKKNENTQFDKQLAELFIEFVRNNLDLITEISKKK